MVSTNYGSLGLLISENTSVKAQLDKLSQQVSTGLVADTYGGLGEPAQTSLDLRPQLASLTNEQSVINAASGQTDVTQNALKQIAAIASKFAAQTVNLNGIDPQAVDTIASSAKSALQQVAGLLDSTEGSTYVFAGIDSANPPVPNPDQILSSGFYAKINAAVSGLSSTTDNSATVIAKTLATASSNAPGITPFSAGLTPPVAAAATVQLGGGQKVQIGLLANANTLTQSTGTTTTGSYVRDLLRGLATIGSLSSTQVTNPGFASVVADTRASLQGAVTALATETGALGENQSELTTLGKGANDTSTALVQQVSSVEDVNTASALSSLSAVQTQLQASYKIIATAQNLSLLQYL